MVADPSCGVTLLNSPRAGRQQGQAGSDGCAGGPFFPAANEFAVCDHRCVPLVELSIPVSAVLTGMTAGLAVAMPLGAIGILLLQEALSHGGRSAAAGAAGIAVVDALYATVAVVAGTRVASGLAGHEREVRLVGAGVLAVVAASGIRGVLAHRHTARGGTEGHEVPGSRPRGTFARFVALTAVNPLTAGAFAVVAVGLSGRWPTAADQVAFVVGVGGASLAWQLTLVAAGTLVGARAGERTRTALGLTGFGLVGVLAVVLATGA